MVEWIWNSSGSNCNFIKKQNNSAWLSVFLEIFRNFSLTLQTLIFLWKFPPLQRETQGENMPTISEFYGIKILMYWDEHNPPHFHAEYAGYQAIVSIRDSAVIKGFLPGKQLKLVLAWSELHSEELMLNWSLAQKHSSLIKIRPLR